MVGLFAPSRTGPEKGLSVSMRVFVCAHMHVCLPLYVVLRKFVTACVSWTRTSRAIFLSTSSGLGSCCFRKCRRVPFSITSFALGSSMISRVQCVTTWQPHAEQQRQRSSRSSVLVPSQVCPQKHSHTHTLPPRHPHTPSTHPPPHPSHPL
jgi:hypothetical protein